MGVLWCRDVADVLIGARWREDAPPQAAAVCNEAGDAAAPVASMATVSVAAGVFLAVALTPLLVSRAFEDDSPAAFSALTETGEIAGWSRTSTPTTTWRPRYLQPPFERFESFTSEGRSVGVYVAFYRHQSGVRKLVSSENVLVASGDIQWLQISAGQRETRIPSGPNRVQTADLSNRAGERLRVWRWYWVEGRWTHSPIYAKALTAFARLSGRGDDSAVVILAMPLATGPDAQQTADAVLESFLGHAIAPLGGELQKMGGRG
ncbi:MAG: EpsI family protein [Betaproteobacteria bacterium]|nr:EpsI family protein [Betaproteobacteria bacterium]